MPELRNDDIGRILRRVYVGPFDGEPLKFVYYGRVSTTMQVDGTGLDDRKESSEMWCDEHNIEIVEYYADHGISGGTTDRPDFQRMLRELPYYIAHGIQGVLTWSLDRFARDVLIQLQEIDRFTKLGVVFVSIYEQADYSTASGRKKIIDDANAAENYRLRHKENMSRAYRFTAIKRKQWVGPPPTGYRRAGKRVGLESNDDAAAIVDLFDLLATDCYSADATAMELRRRGYLGVWNVQTQAYTPWNRYNVLDIARNAAYIGKVRYHDEWFDGNHRAIIADETFNAVQDILNGRVGQKRIIPREEDGLIGGLTWCASCNSPMWQQLRSDRGYISYICSGRQKRLGCQAVAVRDDTIEPQLYLLFERIDLPHEIIDAVAVELAQRAARRARQPVTPAVDLRAIEEKMARLREMYIDGDISRDEYRRRKDVLESQRAIGTPLDSPTPPINIKAAGAFLQDAARLFRESPRKHQSRLLRELFEHIWVGNKIGITAIQPRDTYLLLLGAIQGKSGGPGGLWTSTPYHIPPIWTRFQSPLFPSIAQ